MSEVSNKPLERPRPLHAREEREPGAVGAVAWEQGRLFAQLFADSDEHSGSGASLSGIKASAAAGMVEALAEQLAPRIQAASQWPLQAVLYLPRLGRINARVHREQSAWSVELEAEQDATARWLSGVRQHCEDRFSHVLGLPVNLLLPAAGGA
ncbi:type III secretion system HrpP C-terminal domain-containing protein [Pseudomonas sp. lyk4-R2A-8]|uniref:type III secretion system HrpP C-terminal domain-containing protein n=1 Tax=Pseudomonas sp. lyk4-R2A-8 TaxID=3040316 RepID=UPI0025526AF1|nr:type III secretion system HrpP C-terminal domain-containing protein [Pseudomonas sp. lyk4-R2A-8]